MRRWLILGIPILILLIGGIAVALWRPWEADDSTVSGTDIRGVEYQIHKPTTGKYLTIKEWGIRFQLPEEAKGDVYYAIQPDDEEEGVFFGSLKFERRNADCAATATGLQYGLARREAGKRLSEDDLIPKPEPFRVFGGFEYRWIPSTTLCDFQNADEVSALGEKIRVSIENTLEPMQ